MKYLELINQMTLSEKCGLLSGQDMWTTKSASGLGIEPIFLSDGPSGLRKQLGESDHLGLNASQPATCWPSSATIANSWDPKLCERVGHLIGEEALTQNVNVVLGPGLNIKRSPLCGRNFEYFSEDPYLAGKLAAGYIRGIQSQGVAACPKHFAANSQELRRMASNSVIDERTLREMYLTNFEIAVKESDPKAIMSSYNMVNGIYTNENKHLLQEILVDEWGFGGAVITDWGGSNDHVEGVKAGSHLEMPSTGGDSDRQLEQAVKDGYISEEIINQRVDELLELIFFNQQTTDKITPVFDMQEHHLQAQIAAEQSIVLLKNEGSILPLIKNTKIAVIGDFAQNPRYQGAGSSTVNPTKLDSTLDVLENFPLENIGYAPGFLRNGIQDVGLKAGAVELAAKADVVLFYMGLPEISEIEGLDREHIYLPDNQIAVLHAVATVNPNVVVVLSAGSGVEMSWLKDCKALVYSCLSGQAGAGAVLKVITGQTNPSGKLAETLVMSYEDMPVSTYYLKNQRSAEYREGLYAGYRYFETVGKPVRFPFGFGLSYTTFEYSDLKVSEKSVSFILTNTGSMAGAEVAQMYIGCVNGEIFRPTKELKGFIKVFLQPGESKEIVIPIDDKGFRYFDIKTQKWEIESGNYQIMVGASVHDIRLTDSILLNGTNTPCPYDAEEIPSYYSGCVEEVQLDEFEKLLGYLVPFPDWDTNKPLGLNDTLSQMYYAKSMLARIVFKVLTFLKNRSIAKGKPNLNILFIYNMPFRGIAKMTNGVVTMDMASAILVIVNGHFFKGIAQLVRTFAAGQKLKRIAKKDKS